jgi:FtsP/CotA-like multicopper oxidase with cupredoxin domain
MEKSRFEPGPLGSGAIVLPRHLTRRRFVLGVSSALATAGLAIRQASAGGAVGPDPGHTVLSGTEFNLEVSTLEVNFTGARRTATAVNGQVPGPLLRWREGDTITVRVKNRLSVPTSIHWHGVIVPSDMDGVPGLSFAGIPPGETFVYRFQVNQSGTYWYHSHSRFQEQVGLYGPIVIEPRHGERHAADREHVVLLSDWTDMDPEHLYRTLKLESEYFNYGQRTAGDFIGSVRKQGWKSTVAERRMWGEMRMNPTDLADVSGHTYTYLMNSATPAGNWTGLFKLGERVRLRVINGSSMSYFDFRIPGLKLSVVSADGQDIQAVTVDEFRIGAGEVYDVIVEPREERAYTIFAQSIDRSGYARGTLAPRAGMQAEIPPMDTRSLLTMTDMGMGMGHDNTMGPMVDSIAPDPRTDLDDPGVGLRENGRRVLTYADLRTLDGPIDSRAPGREIVLHLTGHMERFVWSFDGRKFSEAEPLRFNYGERLRLVLINDSMMNHPIHLHGMWGEVESPTGEVVFRKHTINVQPAQRLSYRVTADAIGRWAYHCHLLYHMEAGMFREVHVDRT